MQGIKLAAKLPVGFHYYPAWLESHERVFTVLQDSLNWRQQAIRLFGRQVMQPRLIDWYADEGVRYSYSGITLEPAAWPGELETLRDRLQQASGRRFNSVLCNLYRDGRDSMGWHADNEPELGTSPVIASLNLGAQRRFRVRPRAGGASTGVDLAPGSLLLMDGDSQHDYQHSVPKTARPVGPRINLTFRSVLV